MLLAAPKLSILGFVEVNLPYATPMVSSSGIEAAFAEPAPQFRSTSDTYTAVPLQLTVIAMIGPLNWSDETCLHVSPKSGLNFRPSSVPI